MLEEKCENSTILSEETNGQTAPFNLDAGTGIVLAPKETKVSKEYESASFAELLRYADSKDYFLLIGGVLGSLLTGILNPFVAFIMTDMNSAMIGAQNAININPDTFDVAEFKLSIFSIVIRIAANGLAMVIGAYISMTCFYHLCERQIHKIRQHFLFAVMHQDMEWFDNNQVGTLTQKMSSGIDRIKDGMSDKIGVIIHALISIISGCIIGFCLNWKMTLIMMIMAPCVTLSLYFNARALRRAIRIEMTAYGIAGAIATEVLSEIRTVLSFNAQNFEIERYKSCLKKARTLGIKKATVTGLCTGIFLFFVNLAMGVGFYFGAVFAFNGEMDAGAVFGIFWAIMLGAMRLGQAVPNLNAILSAKLAAGEIFSIIDRKPRIDCSSDAGLKPKTVQGNISFRDIHFNYPSRPSIKILDGVSFDVKPGQKVAFCGHSGCGKSTTIGLLMRFYTASKGSITLDDIPLEDLNVSWLRENIGIVSQEPVLFASTIEENLKMGEEISEKFLENACKTANALDFIQKLPNGFQTLIGEGGIKLSGGQKQRLAIARALVRNPKILLLDEATSALDSESETLVQAALDQASENRTTITIAHRLSTIMNADVIFVFEKGQIVEFGDHETLLKKNGIYSNLVGAQQIDKKKDETDDEFESADEEFDFAGIKTDRNSLEARESARKARASERLSKSITNVVSDNAEVADVEEDVYEEGAASASILDILKFSKAEWKFIFTGFAGAIFTGLRIPIYSLLVGQLFISLSLTDQEVAMNRVFWILIGFIILGVLSGFSCFLGGLLFGIAGETMSSRLRTAVFKIANESIENIRTVQALARQKTLFAAFCNASIEPRKRALIRGYFQSFLYAFGISFSALNFAVCYTFGAVLIAAGYTTPATLFQVIESLNIAAIIIIATSNYFPEYLKARLSAGLMFQMMNEHPKIDAFNEGGLKPDLNGNVSFQKISFSYPNSGKQLILNHLSFTVPAGKTVALCGPSGSGKSTVIQLLERFYDVFDGTVCIDKFDVKQLNIHWLRSLSAVVGQEPALFNLTIRENIAYSMPQVTDAQIHDAAKLANISNFIESLPEKYNTKIGGKGAQLSGGQRQRLAIARAIIRDPKILLLDEATSALDTESEKIVQEALENARQGRTCVVVAHRLSTIQHADLIVVIKDGKVVEIGNHQQLLSAQGLYYNMVLKQQMN